MAEATNPGGHQPRGQNDDAQNAAKIKKANAAASRDKHRQIEKAHRDVSTAQCAALLPLSSAHHEKLTDLTTANATTHA